MRFTYTIELCLNLFWKNERIAVVLSFGIVLKLTVKLCWDSFADEQVVIALFNGMSIHFDDNWFEWPLETSDGSIRKTFSVSEKLKLRLKLVITKSIVMM
jgi:hypothetical protein